MRQQVWYDTIYEKRISIHAPLAGCDPVGGRFYCHRKISIHAPLAGCDSCRKIRQTRLLYFNPRTPCGVRLFSLRFSFLTIRNFNPRTPCGVRPSGSRSPASFLIFQSTHPLRGATYRTKKMQGVLCDFNPRTPCGVRPHPDSGQRRYRYFNPRTPCGVRQQNCRNITVNLRKSYKISAKPNKERRCRVLGKGKAAAISGLARCEPPGENRNASGSHQIMSAPSGA